MSEDPNDISIPPNGRPDTEDGYRLRAAAALYRQIWGTDPEPRSEGASGLYPALRPRPTEHGAGDGLNGGPDLTGRVAELESRLEGPTRCSRRTRSRPSGSTAKRSPR